VTALFNENDEINVLRLSDLTPSGKNQTVPRSEQRNGTRVKKGKNNGHVLELNDEELDDTVLEHEKIERSFKSLQRHDSKNNMISNIETDDDLINV
jgi:hypothetical protein